jgi:ParB family transcriptional regulator, chromosome partitioning protein
MQLTTIALEALSISPANMRHNKRPPDIADILPSVRARGILVPLLVRPNGQPGHYEIIAGRRRYFAAKTIAEEADSSALVALPCAILDDSDDAAALEASLIENIARLDPDEIAQYETFSRLLREGRSIEQIALTFGISERQVKQRLAIGTLHPRLRKLYAADTIDSQTLQLLTLASKSQQAAWLKLLDDPEAYAPTGQRLKSWLMGGTAIPTSNALFKLADYPGTIITDLFGEDSYFGDSDLFWSLQTAVIEQRAQELRDAGWQSVVMLERGERFCSYDHVRHPKAKGGRAYLAIGHDGTLAEHLGYITQREARRIAKGAAAEDTPAVPKAKPEMTQAMANYLALHKQAAVRLELAHQPRMALRLLLLWLLTGSRNLNARPDPQQAHSPAIEASLAHNRAQTLFNDRRTERLAQLGISSDPGDSLTGCGTDIDRDTLFAQLCRAPSRRNFCRLPIRPSRSLAVLRRSACRSTGSRMTVSSNCCAKRRRSTPCSPKWQARTSQQAMSRNPPKCKRPSCRIVSKAEMGAARRTIGCPTGCSLERATRLSHPPLTLPKPDWRHECNQSEQDRQPHWPRAKLCAGPCFA